MTRRRRTFRRSLIIALATFPLLSTGTCLEIATESLIDGFFDATTSIVNDRLSDELGLSTSGSSSSTGGGASGSSTSGSGSDSSTASSPST